MSTPEAPEARPARMKALRAHARGGPEQLVYEDAPMPAAPNGTEVCVEVHAAAITFDELTWPETWEADGEDRTPIIPSHEFSGTVAAVGPSVTGFAIGDAVFGLVPFNRDGAAAEYVLVPESAIARKPSNVPDVTAAAAVLPALTAMEALDEHLLVEPGGRLLVRGGGGGVGALIVQLAHRRGIAVTATVRSTAAAERVRRLGATDVLVGDEPDGITAASFDGAIDSAGAGTPEWLYRAVRPNGRVIMLQEPPDPRIARTFGVDARFFVVSARAESLERLGALLAAEEIEVAIARTCPLSEGAAAYAGKRAAGGPGKTVLMVAAP